MCRVGQDNQDQIDAAVPFTLANSTDQRLNIPNARLDLHADSQRVKPQKKIPRSPVAGIWKGHFTRADVAR